MLRTASFFWLFFFVIYTSAYPQIEDAFFVIILKFSQSFSYYFPCRVLQVSTVLLLPHALVQCYLLQGSFLFPFSFIRFRFVCLGFKSYAVPTLATLKEMIYAGSNLEVDILFKQNFEQKRYSCRPSNNATACSNDGSPNSSVTTVYVLCLPIIYETA